MTGARLPTIREPWVRLRSRVTVWNWPSASGVGWRMVAMPEPASNLLRGVGPGQERAHTGLVRRAGQGARPGEGDVTISYHSDLVPILALSTPSSPHPCPFLGSPPPSLIPRVYPEQPPGANCPWLYGPRDHLAAFLLYGCSCPTRIWISPRPELDLSLPVHGIEEESSPATNF